MGADIKHFALEQKDDNTYGWPWNEVVRSCQREKVSTVI